MNYKSKITMKKILYFVSIFILATPVHASTINDTIEIWMNEGNTLYQQKKFNEAIDSYQKIIEKNYESATLFYNLGNAYYKNEENGKAILWYERALKLDPSNEDIIHNIAFVNQKLEDKIDVLPELFLHRWYVSIASSMTSNQWATLSIVFFIMVLLSVLAYLLIHISWVKTSSIFSLFLSVVILTFSIVFSYRNSTISNKHPEAVILKSVINGKSTPNESGTDLFVIHEGLKVKITDQLNDWIEIKLPNGEKGWVKYSDVEMI